LNFLRFYSLLIKKENLMKNFKILTYFIIAVWAVGCNPKDDPAVVNKYFTQAEVASEGSREQVITDLKAAFGEGSQTAAFIQGFVRYGLKRVRISYKTKNTDGTEITASGALFLPITTDTKETFPLASVQH
jgi:hypothetical protein